ncbi:transcription factor HES-1-like [Myxocyprinus asiaticus]|uniref:transcription factor HES-1-like n=1 Tax=Myxocyprinus asiaticus TaxID=70543 RepID=UPI0022225E44|nr:transcription factor HES-1-like [Myxocyprinus asiaticus]
MTSKMSGGTPHKITSQLSASSSGHEQRCALTTQMNATSDQPSTALEHRKSSKPIMEKRRRARINNSLCQLKTLILDALSKDTARHSKLEKADILEMTVKHLKNLKRAQINATFGTSLPMLGKYRAGFNECIHEVTRFMSTHESVDTEVKNRLLSHLVGYVSHLDIMSCPPQHHLRSCASKPGFEPPPVSHTNGPLFIWPPETLKLHCGLQFVPSSDGTFSLLIPGSSSIGLTGPHNGAPQAGVSSDMQMNSPDLIWRPW